MSRYTNEESYYYHNENRNYEQKYFCLRSITEKLLNSRLKNLTNVKPDLKIEMIENSLGFKFFKDEKSELKEIL